MGGRRKLVHAICCRTRVPIAQLRNSPDARSYWAGHAASVKLGYVSIPNRVRNKSSWRVRIEGSCCCGSWSWLSLCIQCQVTKTRPCRYYMGPACCPKKPKKKGEMSLARHCRVANISTCSGRCSHGTGPAQVKHNGGWGPLNIGSGKSDPPGSPISNSKFAGHRPCSHQIRIRCPEHCVA